MNLSTVRVLSTAVIVAGCVRPSDTWSDDTGGGGSGGVGGEQWQGGRFPVTTGTGPSEEVTFDPCPSDRYTFQLPSGEQITMEIEVFCDKRRYIDTGYPLP